VSGDPDAFGTLFARHRDRLWAVAVRTLGDPDDAADALQDAMISAFRGAGRFRGDSAVTTWLHRIVVNACLDLLRRRAARPATGGLAAEALDAVAAGHGPAQPDTDTSLDVTAALRTLPPEQRVALVLVDMLGYRVAEAAAVLGVSEGTVKSRCSRGRARLLPRLAHLRGPAADPAGGQAAGMARAVPTTSAPGAGPGSGPGRVPIPGPRSGHGPGPEPGRGPGNRTPAGDVSAAERGGENR
jgi:RNA polymerase sigma-70 factor, ECF subfamily